MLKPFPVMGSWHCFTHINSPQKTPPFLGDMSVKSPYFVGEITIFHGEITTFPSFFMVKSPCFVGEIITIFWHLHRFGAFPKRFFRTAPRFGFPLLLRLHRGRDLPVRAAAVREHQPHRAAQDARGAATNGWATKMGEVGNLVGFSWDFVGFHKENHDLMRTYEDEPTKMRFFLGLLGGFAALILSPGSGE